MRKTKLCRWCGNESAIIPIDRDNIGRLKKEICGNCHAQRLQEDLKVIIALENKKRKVEND